MKSLWRQECGILPWGLTHNIQADIAVIGAGVVGLTIVYELQKRTAARL